MARPQVIQNDAILTAARAVFLERGTLGTSLEIAHRAGVSEATVFKRFKTKAELFRVALEIEEEPPALRDLPTQVGLGDVEGNLLAAAVGTLQHLERAVPLWKLRVASGERVRPVGSLASRWGERGLRAYLEGEIGRGRLQPIDVRVAAVAFLGALIAPALLIADGASDVSEIDRERYARACVGMLWSGIRPH